MPDLNDGEALDFRRLFRVHRLFAAVPMALRPGALLLAAFLVLLLSLGGRFWDGIRGPSIDSPGLLQPVMTDAARNVTKQRLFRIMTEFVPRDERPADLQMESIDPRWLHGSLEGLRRSLSRETDAAQFERVSKAMIEVESLTPRGTWESTSRAVGQGLDALTAGVIRVSPSLVVDAIGALVIELPIALWQRDRGFVIFYGFLAALVLSVGGGALSRMTAHALADRPALPPSDALGFAMGRWTSFAFAVLLPPLFVGGLFLLGGVMGFLLRVPLLNIVGGALYGIALFLGFLATLAGLLWVIALPLSTPAGACDGADAIESSQRAWAYMLRRPLLGLGYLVAGVIAWGLGMFVVQLFAIVTLNLTAASGTWLSGAPALSAAGGLPLFGSEGIPSAALTGTDRIAASLIDFWQQVVQILVTGAALGMFWSISTAAYLCLRHACDDQPFEDLWDPEESPGVRVEPG